MSKIRKLAGEWAPGVLLTLGTLWVVQGALAYTPGHGIIVQGLNYNAGVVKSGTVVSHNLRVINLSALSVQVDAQPGCGCTVADTPTHFLAPLHSEVVKTQIDTTGMKYGLQRKGVFVSLLTGRQAWQQVATVQFRLQ